MDEQKNYRINLSGNDISVDKQISEDLAHKILLLLVPSNSTRLVDTSAKGEVATIGEPSVKEFILQKKPATDTERITCLAYYLNRFKHVQEFKTEELTDLNREAQQIRFSNPSATARNAVSVGYLALAGGGRKQITTIGEALVEALPDRDLAKKALEGSNRRKRSRKKRPENN